jgi:hydrophobic/amphiphilic exporter-1 (mainly G- bacteria), HAE1 family
MCSQITIQFNLDRNIDGAAQDVQAAINAAQGSLPKGLPTPPTYRKVNPADAPIMITAVQSQTLPLTTVDDYAENVLSQQITQVEGVAQVQASGQQKPSLRVEVDPARLFDAGLTLEDVRAVLSKVTADAPKGEFEGQDNALTIYANDQVITPDRLGATLVLSQALTLYTTPVIYLYLETLRRWLTPSKTVKMPRLAAKMNAAE